MCKLDIKEVAHKDEHLCLPTSYGFVIAPDGSLYQLTRQYHHGVVIALLNPECAVRMGFGIPDKDDYSVYDYQSFEFDSAKELGYIRVGYGLYNRIAYHYENKITKEQLDSLKTYMHNTGIVDEDFQTDFGEYDGRKVLVELKKLHDKQKMDGAFLEPTEDDLKSLVEPETI